MPRATLPTPEQVPAASKPTLDMFTKNIGFTPNMLATFATSPVAFNSWATLLGSLSKTLDVKTRDAIGLAVSEVNGCDYCLTLHSYMAEHMAKLQAPPPKAPASPPSDPNKVFKIDTTGAPGKGSKTASVTIVEFSDFQ